jgi:hypothetical protein
MISGADIPPELFTRILLYVGEESALRDIWSHERRITIAHLTACCLTCVYWAKACRPKIFKHILLQSYDDVHSLSLLVSLTPKTLSPILDLVHVLHLVQYLNGRPWLHVLQLRPSLGFSKLPFKTNIHLVGPGIIGRNFEHTVSPSPRTLSPTCWRCNGLTLQSIRLRSPKDIRQWLRRSSFNASNFEHCITIDINLADVTWGVQVRNFLDINLNDQPLVLPSFPIVINVKQCTNNLELAWATFSCAAADYYIADRRKPQRVRQILASDYKVLIDVSITMQTVANLGLSEHGDPSKFEVCLRRDDLHNRALSGREGNLRQGDYYSYMCVAILI